MESRLESELAYSADYKTVQIPLRTVPVAALRGLTQQLLRATELAAEDADIIADALVTSELRNLQGQGQGVRRVRAYVERVRARHVDPAAPFEIVKESPALALVDAHNAPGTVVAVKAMRMAVQKAKVCGVGMALVRHSTHFGSASYSAAQALPHGCIGVSMTNAGPEMAPWGGIDGVVGTNPWAVAVPTGEVPDAMPIILDMALTTAGKGMMRWLLRDGRKMPRNWAITADGRTTDEPAEAMDGTLLPMGEYKGYGLSLITDVLTGVLSGGAYGTVPYSNQARQDVAHQFIAYDIAWFQALPEFYAHVQDFLRMVKGSRTRPGVAEILLPGELEWRRQQEKLARGVPLDPEVYEDLRQLAGECGVDWTL
jgi:LDH2 family malate/lactate/ureidoglycolate dehydrogenase